MLIKILLEKNVVASKLCEIIKIYPQVLVNAKVDSNKKYKYEENKEISKEIQSLEKEFCENGRILIRPSGTESLIRVMIEGEDIDKITKKANNLAKLIEKNLN